MKSAAASAKPVVWLIEDHADSRRVLARVLNRSAKLLCPCAFASCEEALAALKVKPAPDVVLLDIGLPGMNGIEGIPHLKALAPATHIIILTVFDDQEKVFFVHRGVTGVYLSQNLASRHAKHARKPVGRDRAVGAQQRVQWNLDCLFFKGVSFGPDLVALDPEQAEFVVDDFPRADVAAPAGPTGLGERFRPRMLGTPKIFEWRGHQLFFLPVDTQFFRILSCSKKQRWGQQDQEQGETFHGGRVSKVYFGRWRLSLRATAGCVVMHSFFTAHAAVQGRSSQKLYPEA